MTRLRGVLSAVLTLGLVAPAHAGIDAWTTGDQVGGFASAAAVEGSRALAGTVSGGSGGGLFRSADGGLTWERVPALDYREVQSVAIDPAPGQPMYAATRTGMWRSLDGGTSWAEIAGAGSGVGQFYERVAVDRGTPGTVFFVRFFSDGAGVFRSTTGGAGSWTSVGGGLPSNTLHGIVVDPVTHVAWGWIYGGGVYTLPAGGNTWTAANTGLPSTSVVGLALDESGSRRIVAATTSGPASLPAAGGPSWTPLNDGLPESDDRYGTSVTADGGGAVYLTSLDGMIRRLPPGGTTWSTVAAAGMPAHFSDFVVGDPATSGRVLSMVSSALFAPSVGLGPLWRTADGGATFARAAAGFRAVEVATVVPDPRQPGRVLAATGTDGVQGSADRGATWTLGGTGLPSLDARGLAADGADAGVWYASPGGAEGVYRSSDGGASWTAVGTGDPVNPSHLGTVPGRSGVVFVASGSTVAKSTDHGDTWTPTPALPGSVRELVPDPAQPGAMWAATTGVRHLADGAPTWEDRSTGLSGLAVSGLAVDPRAPATLFAATSGGGVYRSTDAGGSWTPASNGIPDSFISDVVVDPKTAGTVYAASRGGVFRSTDNGTTWAALVGGVALPPVADLAFDADGLTLYAGTSAIGVLARTPFVPTPALGRAPALLSAPTVTGTARRGQTLTGAPGTWDGLPAPTLAVQWQRCNASGTTCTAIGGVTGATYRLAVADVGRRIRLLGTATNASGTATAASALTATVRSAPVRLRNPAIRGRVRAGRLIRPRRAQFAASPTPRLTYRWQRCPRRGGTCRSIRRATRSSYVPRSADRGRRLRLVVTARNTLGRMSARSPRSAVVR